MHSKNEKTLARRELFRYGGLAIIGAGLGFSGYRSGWLSGKQSSETKLTTQRFAAMGTYLDISCDEKVDGAIIADCVRMFSQIEERLSFFNSRSDVGELNRRGYVQGSGHLQAVLQESRHIHRTTDGAFDPTVAPLMALWGFHGHYLSDIPGVDLLRKTQERVGLDKLSGTHSLRFSKEDMSLDLGAIAKGYAVDQAAHILEHHKIAGIINAGGDIRVTGKTENPRKIGVKDPLHPEKIFATIDLQDHYAVATSGTYHQSYQHKGQRISHIIDPRTATPAKAILSATVIAPKAIQADALATACTVLQPQEALALIANIPNTQALLAWETPTGTVNIDATPNLDVNILHKLV